MTKAALSPLRLPSVALLCGAAIVVVSAASAAVIETPLTLGEKTAVELEPGTAREFVLAVSAGQRLTVTVDSPTFAHHLVLQGEEPGHQSQCNGFHTVMAHDAAGAGSVRALVEAADTREGGTFTIEAAVSQGQEATLMEHSTVRFGETVHGQLTRGDSTQLGGEYRDRYVLAGRAGQHVTITLTSRDFDAYLILRCPGGGELDDDDSAGRRNAQISLALPVSGDYQIDVTTVRVGGQGSYDLHVR